MPHNFVAYIDESGDEGYNIVPPPERRSSEWFVLGAVIVPVVSVPEIDATCAEPFHFRKVQHHAKIAYVEKVASLPICATLVAFHKPSVPDNAAIRTRSHYLFDYSAKLLIERISWYCDEHPNRGSAKIIFANRHQLKIDRIKNYLRHLSGLTGVFGGMDIPELARNTIRWNRINIDDVEVSTPDELPGLRCADTLVSSFTNAIEWSRSHNTEHRYVKMLKDKFYRRNNQCVSYGIKFMPANAPDNDGPQVRPRFHWIHHFR
jgi:hypothetical protein